MGSRNKGLEKIRAIEQNLDQQNLKRIKEAEKRGRYLFWSIAIFFFLAISAVLTLINLGIISIYGSPSVSTVNLVEAKADSSGTLRIILEVEDLFEQGQRLRMGSLRATLLDKKNKDEVDAEVIPLFLKNGTVQILIMNPGIYHLPGECDLEVYLSGKQNVTNTVTIKNLQPSNT